MVYGIIDRNIHEFYTYLSVVFNAISNAHENYNWLITDCECYPKNKEIEQLLNKEYCWMTGEELSDMIAKEDFQWIWGVLCGFTKDIPLDEVLKHPLPSIWDYNGYFRNPVSLQHPLSSVEIAPVDSFYTLIISKEKTIVDSYQRRYPQVENLSQFNKQGK